jgi:hypothetical protein
MHDPAFQPTSGRLLPCTSCLALPKGSYVTLFDPAGDNENRDLGNYFALFFGATIKVRTCPFSFINLPKKSRGRWAWGLLPAAMKRCHWLESVLVAKDVVRE